FVFVETGHPITLLCLGSNLLCVSIYFRYVLIYPCLTSRLFHVSALPHSLFLLRVALHVHSRLCYCAITFLFGISSFLVATVKPLSTQPQLLCADTLTPTLVVFPSASLIFFLTFFQVFKLALSPSCR